MRGDWHGAGGGVRPGLSRHAAGSAHRRSGVHTAAILSRRVCSHDALGNNLVSRFPPGGVTLAPLGTAQGDGHVATIPAEVVTQEGDAASVAAPTMPVQGASSSRARVYRSKRLLPQRAYAPPRAASVPGAILSACVRTTLMRAGSTAATAPLAEQVDTVASRERLVEGCWSEHSAAGQTADAEVRTPTDSARPSAPAQAQPAPRPMCSPARTRRRDAGVYGRCMHGGAASHSQTRFRRRVAPRLTTFSPSLGFC